MDLKRSIGWAVLTAAVLVGCGCGKSKKAIVVGSKDGPGQVLIGEIVAQHLEHRLGRKVIRNLSLGSTALAYQAFINAEVGIYPDETGTLQAQILKESPSLDAPATLERVRNEMRRMAQAEVLDPLGIDSSWAILIKKDNAAKNKIETLSDAAAVKEGWKLGVTRDFNERNDGLATLNQYRLPMSAMTFVGDSVSVYELFQGGKLTMMVGTMTDGWLSRHDTWTALRDDKRVFPYYQTCLIARADLLANDPKIQPALAELSGKFTNADMQKLNAKVTFDHKKPADVAAEFLAQAGLK